MRIALALRPGLLPAFLSPRELARLHDIGDVVTLADPLDLSSTSSRAALSDAEIVVTGWGTAMIDADVLEHAPLLRAVAHTAGSVRAHVDPIAFERGIAVSSQVEANARPVAEYALSMILLAGKRAFRIAQAYRAKRTAVDQIEALAGAGNNGSTVGIVGASRTGRLVLEYLRPFDIRVLVHDPYLSPEIATAMEVESVELDELMSRSDVISLHAPLLDTTRGMISAPLLARMPDGATLINTARGGLIDQAALVRELRSGRIGAILDVTDPEVLPENSELWDLANVFITPHIAGSGGNELLRLGAGTVDEVESFARTGHFQHPVAPSFEISA